MAKPPSISALDVEEAANELRNKGKPVNPYQVRKLLGTGSYKLIEEYLGILQLETEYDDEDPLTKQLIGLVRPLAQTLKDEQFQAIEQAEAKYQAQTQQWQDKFEKKNAELMMAHETVDNQTKQLESLELEKESIAINTQKQVTEIQDLHYRVRSLTEAANESKNHINSLEEKHIHAREALEHFRESVKDQRDKDQRQHEQQVQQLQAELRQSKVYSTEQALNKSSDELLIKNRELETLTSNTNKHTQDIASLNERMTESEQDNQKLVLEINTLKTELTIKNQVFEKLGKN
jgi:DNA repair exonuclease SbcCD ATPase subunit